MPSIQYQAHVFNTLLNTQVEYNIKHTYVFNANTCVQCNIKHNVSYTISTTYVSNTKSNTCLQYHINNVCFQYKIKCMSSIQRQANVFNTLLHTLVQYNIEHAYVFKAISHTLVKYNTKQNISKYYINRMFSIQYPTYVFNTLLNTLVQYSRFKCKHMRAIYIKYNVSKTISTTYVFNTKQVHAFNTIPNAYSQYIIEHTCPI